MPDIGPSRSDAKTFFSSSAIAAGSGVFTGTMANDMPFITSTSKTAIASSMPAISSSLPDRVMVCRASSDRIMLLRGQIGSRMRRLSEAATYLSCTTWTCEPSFSSISAGPETLMVAPTTAWSSGTIRYWPSA